jgi:hypothetical protein
MTEFTKERMDELHEIICNIIIDMDDLHMRELEGPEVYSKRVMTIAHVILYSLIGEMSEKKEI